MSVSAVKVVIDHSDMVHVLMKIVAVIIHVLEINNRYVEETGKSPSIQSVRINKSGTSRVNKCWVLGT